MNDSVPTEKDLIKHAKAGDVKAMEELVSRYEGKVYNLAYKMMGNRDDAEDVLQDAFLSAIRALGDFREESSFSTWIYRIATNAALTRLRKRGRKEKSEAEFLDEVYSVKKQAHEPSMMVDWSDSPVKSLLEEEARGMMGEAIGQLPESYRVVFVLRDVQGLPAAEVGEILGLSVPAVKSRLHRARMFLRNSLSRYFEEIS